MLLLQALLVSQRFWIMRSLSRPLIIVRLPELSLIDTSEGFLHKPDFASRLSVLSSFSVRQNPDGW
jgi:hypothetical protein